MVKHWLLAIGILGVLAACSESDVATDLPGSTGTVIDSFGANPVPSPINIGTQFSWTVYGQNLVCTLDVEGDGKVDYTVQSCTSQSRVNHTYGVQGSFNARLTVTGADGETRLATTPVQVVAANVPPAPRVQIAPPAASSSNPLAVVFGWQVEDANADVTHCRFDAQSDGVWEYDGLCAGTSTSNEVKASNVVQYNFNYTYPKAGKYTATLEARDPYSANSTTVQVRAPYNRNPVIDVFTATPGDNKLATVKFAVTDPDGDSLECTLVVEGVGSFRFPNCTEGVRNYTFKAEGSYLVTLVVTDSLGGRVSSSKVVTFGGQKRIAEGMMAATYYSTCFLTPVGKVYCWGKNEQGELGNGTDGSSTTPQPVKTGLRFKQISGSYYHVCAVSESNEAYCWGGNDYGALGDGTKELRKEPTKVQTNERFVQISAGGSEGVTCGVSMAGDIFCWGDDTYDQLVNSSLLPVKAAAGGTKFSQVSVGFYHVCGLSTEGKAYCWGYNDWGETGNNPSGPDYNTPQAVLQNYTFKSLSANLYFTCGLVAAGSATGTEGDVYCWGRNNNGQLGLGSSDTNPHFTGEKVPGHTFARHFSGWYSYHSCGIKADGETWCWGRNNYGQVGVGSSGNPVLTPTQINSFKFSQISTSVYHTCGYTVDETLMCWGYNAYGQLGNGTTTGEDPNPSPLLVNPLP